MAINFFRKVNLLSLAIKVGLIYIVSITSGYEEYLRSIPFFVTRFQDYERVKEAHYFIEQGQDPYTIEHVFQKPIEVFVFYWCKNIPGLIPALFLIADLIISEVISSQLFVHSRSHMKKLTGGKYKIESVMKIESQKKIERDQSIVRLAYLLNPLSICALLVKWTSIFEFAFALLGVYCLHNKKCPVFLAGLFYGFGVYCNPVMIMLIPVIFLSLDYQNGRSKSGLFVFWVVALLTIFGSLYYSFILTNSWKFIKESYLKAYHVSIFDPTIGMIWALFSGMFNRYQLFYHCFFAALPLVLLYPIYKILSKGIRKFKWDVQYNGLLGYACSICLFVGYLYFSFVTAFELSLFITMFFSAYQYAFKVQVLIIFNYTAAYMAGLTSCLTGLWIYGLTGNPNFCFFQTTVLHVFAIAAFTESIKEYAKGHPIEELKQSEQQEEQQKKVQQKKNQ